MYAYAKYNARKGETPQQAGVRLLRERDQYMSEQFVKVKKLDPDDESLDAFANELGITCDLAEHQALPTLLLMAAMKAKPGESAEAALRRLLRERDDEIMQVAQEHDPVRQESLRIAEIKDSTPGRAVRQGADEPARRDDEHRQAGGTRRVKRPSSPSCG